DGGLHRTSDDQSDHALHDVLCGAISMTVDSDSTISVSGRYQPYRLVTSALRTRKNLVVLPGTIRVGAFGVAKDRSSRLQRCRKDARQSAAEAFAPCSQSSQPPMTRRAA